MSTVKLATFYFVALFASVTSARAQDATTTADDEQQAEDLYFPEGHQAPGHLLVLEEALAREFNKLGPQTVMQTYGLFERGAAWKSGDRLAVCFMDGSLELQRRVAAIALEWNFSDAPVTLDFGSADTPRQCGSERPHIRVSFQTTFSWSPVGNQNTSSAMLLALTPTQPLSDAKFRQIVLHEFGHALGLWHELKHAEGMCWSEFKWVELQSFYRANFGMGDEETIKLAIKTFDPIVMADQFAVTSFDPDSIMMYAFPASLYRNGSASRCWAPLRDRISDGDKLTLQRAYMKPQLAASIIAGLSSELNADGRNLANAYIALLLADERTQGVLRDAVGELPASASATDIASAILSSSERLSVQRYGQR